MSASEQPLGSTTAKPVKRLAVLRTFEGPAGETGAGALLTLARVQAKLAAMMARQIKPHGLTLGQFDVLMSLGTGEGISQQELTERLLVTKGNTCVVVQKMESLGWIERRDDEHDQRIHRLYLTSKGRQLLSVIVPAHLKLMGRITSALTPAEQGTLLQLLLRVQTNLDLLDADLE